MEDLEKTQRLKEILAKLDPRAETRVREGGLFKAAELLRRRLLHEGMLLWKTPGSRHKGAQHGWGGDGPGSGVTRKSKSWSEPIRAQDHCSRSTRVSDTTTNSSEKPGPGRHLVTWLEDQGPS